ncbi:cytochrome P450, partial [Streptomyces rubiginosohelvolus]
ALDSRDEHVEQLSKMFVFLLAEIKEHVKNPREDLISYLLDVELRGRKLDPNHIISMMLLLFAAGIGTTTKAIGSSLWHLAGNPRDRERLVAEPELLPTALEEFLRAFTPVTMARLVKDDMHWRGVDMKADDWILLSFPAANRDPAQFDRADEVVIDREANRHAAFGLGIHRCLGSHLARMELRVALEVWLERIPDFSLEDASAVVWGGRLARGPVCLPLRFGRRSQPTPGGPQ